MTVRLDPTLAAERAAPGYSVMVALLLSGVAGFVDAFAYLTVYHIYTANMSGNSIGMITSAAQGKWVDAFIHAWPIFGFLVGLSMGSVILQSPPVRRLIWLLSVCVGVEIALLICFLIVGISTPIPSTIGAGNLGRFALLIVFPTIAMGVQNVTLRKAGGVSIFTTHVTGTLTKMVEDATQFAFWVRRHLLSHRPRRFRRTLVAMGRTPAFHSTVEMLSLWLIYLVGGIVATLTRKPLGYVALVCPIAALSLAMIHNLIRAHQQHG